MIRRLLVMIAVLSMVATFALKVNAQQPTANTTRPQGQGEGAQLRQRIEALEQQAKQLRVQLEQIEAKARPIREQFRYIQDKIKVEREKLRYLHEERREERKEHYQEMKQQNHTYKQTTTGSTISTATSQQK